MGLLASLIMGFGFMGFCESFLCGMWGLGLGSFLCGFMIFTNLGVECLGSFIWSSGLGLWLVVISLWIGGVCYMCSGYYSIKDRNIFGVCVYLLSLICAGLFLVAGWFIFFFFFEAALVPIVVLILGWGYQPERLQAAGYMVVYTVCASLPLLFVLLYLCSSMGSSSFFIKTEEVSGLGGSGLILVLLLGAFLVKSPVFMVHLWLPKAHVEAPVSGSMILAGILLKFGGYGCLLVFYYFVVKSVSMYCFLISVILWGGLVCGLICLRQVDMKSLIAYSSIGHMALCLVGVMSCSGLGWWGGLMMMVAHGLCSPGLFSLAGYVYKMFSSRSLLICSGVLGLVPVMSLCWFLMSSSNMAFPPSFSLMAELMLMMSAVFVSWWFMVPLAFMIFVVGVYSLMLYSYVQHGSVSQLVMAGSSLGIDYILVSFLLWVPLNLLILCGDAMSGWL